MAAVRQKKVSGSGGYGRCTFVYCGKCVRHIDYDYVLVAVYDIWIFLVLYRAVFIGERDHMGEK